MTTTEKSLQDSILKHSWGTRFKTTRESLRLTEKDAAARLRLKPHVIAIIENEKFVDGPPAIFMRGYIRSYGRLLNLSEKEITQALAQFDLGPQVMPALSPHLRKKIVQPQNNLVWSSALVLLILAGLVGMWWKNNSYNNLLDLLPNLQTKTLPAVTPTTQNAAPALPKSNANMPTDPTPAELIVPPAVTSAANNNVTTPIQASPNIAAKTAAEPAQTTASAPDISAVLLDNPTNNTDAAEPVTNANLAKKSFSEDLSEAKMEVPEQGLDER
jgi:cytoskeleton protein RodZ